jgi:hypothetical protein
MAKICSRLVAVAVFYAVGSDAAAYNFQRMIALFKGIEYFPLAYRGIADRNMTIALNQHRGLGLNISSLLAAQEEEQTCTDILLASNMMAPMGECVVPDTVYAGSNEHLQDQMYGAPPPGPPRQALSKAVSLDQDQKTEQVDTTIPLDHHSNLRALSSLPRQISFKLPAVGVVIPIVMLVGAALLWAVAT